MNFVVPYLLIGVLYSVMFWGEIKQASHKPVIAACAVTVTWPAFFAFVLLDVIDTLRKNLK